MTHATAPLVFATDAYGWMRDDLCRQGGYDAGGIDRKSFPDGERYLRLATPVTDRDVVVVGGTHSDAATLELYDLACGIVKSGARRLTLVVPYFGYSTMERAAKAGEVVTAKTRARLLSAVPHAQGGNRVLLLDLHQEGIPHYFEDDVIAVHVYAKPVTTAAIRRVGASPGGDNFVLACTDAGRAKWVQSLANDLGVQPSFVFKRRLDGDQTEVTAVSAQVAGKRVVIYDDMIRTGGSLLGAARAYRAAGAASQAAVATHGVLPGDSLQRIRDSGLFTAVVCTDSHPRARELAPQFTGFLAVEPVAQVFLPYIQP
jgi:ribose-phosphate pyrophosphokinase